MFFFLPVKAGFFAFIPVISASDPIVIGEQETDLILCFEPQTGQAHRFS